MAITRIGSYSQLKGTSYKLPCRLATTGDVNFLSPPSTVDGFTYSTGDRILVWQQSLSNENGIYIAGPTWSRAVDFSTKSDVYEGVQVYVTNGTSNIISSYILTTPNPIDFGVTNLTFSLTFVASDYDLEDFTNVSADPFIRQSEVISDATNLSYTPSPTQGTIASDTGTDATIPLADNTNAGLLSSVEKAEIATALQPSDITGFIPYSGATSDVDLGEHQLKSGQLELDQTPIGAFSTAKIRWNDSAGTAEIRLKGDSVTLQLGQEIVKRVVNKTATNITLQESAYQVVKIIGATGQRLSVDLAQANSEINSTTALGIVTENIVNNQEGFVTLLGEINLINTTGSLQGETWADGDVLYLSPTVAGQLTNVAPVAPNHTVRIGYVQYAHVNNGKIHVDVDRGYSLENLHNVKITGTTDNKFIASTTEGLWENKTIDEVLGYVPENVANKQNSLDVDGSGGRFPTVDAVNAEVAKIDATKKVITSQINNTDGNLGQILTKNLIDTTTFTPSTLINYIYGITGASGIYSSTDYMTVEPNQKYRYIVTSGGSGSVAGAWYTADNVYISGINTTGTDVLLTAPSNAYKVRLSYPNVININNFFFYPVLKFTSYGDSITIQNKWQPLLCRYLGLFPVNVGFSGFPISGVTTSSLNNDVNINTIPTDSEIVTFLGGTNDWAQNYPLGAQNSTDISEFYGALNITISKLKVRCPNATIVMLTTTYGEAPGRVGFSVPKGELNALGLKTTDYAQACLTSAKNNNIKFIRTDNLWDTNNILNFVETETSYVHPNDAGAELMSSKISADLVQSVLELKAKIANIGSGTANTIPKWTSVTGQSDSNITDTGSLVTINSTTQLNGLQTLKGTSGSDGGVYGSELTTTATGTNWTGTNFTSGYTHTVGSTVALTSSLVAVSSTYYQITYTISGRTAGSVSISYGGISITGITSTGNSGQQASSTSALSITPTTDFDGTLVLSIKTITLGLATTSFMNSSGTVTDEIRATRYNTNSTKGVSAGSNLTTGINETLNGYRAGFKLTSGSNNTANGALALNTAVIGANNDASGYSSLVSNLADYNTAKGSFSGQANTTGSRNVYEGGQSGYNQTTGSDNVFSGYQAARFISGGSVANTISNNSIFIGSGSKPLADNQTNQIVIGKDAIGLGSNSTVIGTISTTTAKIWGSQDSPSFTGTPTAPTATVGTNTTQIATTAFVKENIDTSVHWTKTGNEIRNNNSGKVKIGADYGYGFSGALEVSKGGNNVGIATDGRVVAVDGFGLQDQSSGMRWLNSAVTFTSYGNGFRFNPIYLNSPGISTNVDIVSFSNALINPTSGSANFNMYNISPTVNQTGGANGITRGIYINPTLTSATDFRAIEVTAGKTILQEVELQKPIKLKGYTVATLPTGTQGDTAYVTDALAPTYLTTVVGGGTVVCPVFFDGVSWKAH